MRALKWGHAPNTWQFSKMDGESEILQLHPSQLYLVYWYTVSSYCFRPKTHILQFEERGMGSPHDSFSLSVACRDLKGGNNYQGIFKAGHVNHLNHVP